MVEDENEFLLDLCTYIPELLRQLWKNPKIVEKLLLYSDINNVKENLAPFVCNNLYENILSPYKADENLLYIISLLLKNEINKLNSVNEFENFLDNTPCGYLLSELKNKIDIQTYSKNIIQSLVQKIEEGFSERQMNLNIKNLTDIILQMEENLKKKNKDIKNLEDIIFLNNFELSLNGKKEKNNEESIINNFKIMNKKQIDLFNQIYICNLGIKELENIRNNYEDNQYMKEYISYYIQQCNNDNTLFTNETLINKVYNLNYSNIVLVLYQIDFLKMIELIDLFISSLYESIQFLPYSVKFICKLISMFIKKKFPDIKKFEENAFIGKFLFNCLLFPIIRNPIKTFIKLFNNFIISNYSLTNLRLLLEIFTQLALGKLYNNKNHYFYTPFNWYFLEKMPKIFEFYENIKKVNLPKFIEDLVNEKLPDDYRYDYFKENPDEIISFRSICFSITDIKCLLDNIINNKSKLFPEISVNPDINNNADIDIEDNIADRNNSISININNFKNNINKPNGNNDIDILYVIINKLNSDFYQNLLNSINKRILKQKENPKIKEPIPNLVLINDFLINPNYSHLFNIKVKKEYFYLKELSKIENEEDYKINNIIKVKNYLIAILYNCRKLNDIDFFSKNNTFEILKEIKSFLKSNEFVIDDNIPYEWYINSLLECLKKIPKELAENDYENLYKELEDELNKSISLIDFDMMSECFGKVKYTKNSIDYYKQLKKLIIEIDLNERVKEIIEKKRIPMEMKFIFNDKQKEFNLNKPSLSENQISELFMGEINEFCRICLTIDEFIKYFPNFKKIQILSGIDLLKEIKEMNIANKINNYFNFIVDVINKEKNFTKEEFMIVKEKLYDFIFTKLYDKLYPAFASNIDLIILRNCLKLSWIEPKHLIENGNNYNFDIFMDDIKQYFNEFEKEKSPNKKIKILNKIFKIISKIMDFNNWDSEHGADDNITILIYIFIKIHQKKIYSDIKYIKLFLKDDDSGPEENQIIHFLSACEVIKNFDHTHLYNVTEDEYFNNCKESMEKMSKFVKIELEF